GRWKTVYNPPFRQLGSKAGHFRQSFEVLKVHLDRSGSLVDATIARAHQDAARWERGARSQSPGSFTWRLFDQNPRGRRCPKGGRPLHVELTPGTQQHEATVALSLLAHAQGRAF